MSRHNFTVIVTMSAGLFLLVLSGTAVNNTNLNVVKNNDNAYESTTWNTTHGNGHKTLNISNAACDCGKYSLSCAFKNGLKVCNCTSGYADRYEKCIKCDCGKKSTSCWFDSKLKLRRCTCEDGYSGKAIYMDFDQTCIECNCGRGGSSCKYDENSKKKCECKPGYAVKVDRWGDEQNCDDCDCGEGGASCRFSAGGYKICTCNDGYSEYNSYCKTCNCGNYSYNCYFKGLEKTCSCYSGYLQTNTSFTGTCEACDCGVFSKFCEYENGIKKCNCKSGYVPKAGICTNCYCGSNAESCEFTALGEKKCRCREGYVAERNGDEEICKEKCDCGPNSYSCELGYTGNRKCTCKQGYIPKYQSFFTNDEYCEEEIKNIKIITKDDFPTKAASGPTGWRIATYVTLTIFVLIIIALILYISTKKSAM